MPKIRLTDLIIFSLLFTAVISFPFNMLNIPYWAKYLIRISLSLILLLSYVFCFKRYGISIVGKANKKNLLFMIPLVGVMCCNILTLPAANAVFLNQSFITNGIFFFELFLTILQAINEEILFRLFIHTQIPVKNRLLKIVLSSLIFALFHLLNFFTSGFNPDVLIQVAYTFGLGLVLGFIYEYGESIISCFIFHSLYNVLNTTIYSVLLTVNITYFSYYLVIGLIVGISFVYMLLIYLFVFRKQDRNRFEIYY